MFVLTRHSPHLMNNFDRCKELRYFTEVIYCSGRHHARHSSRYQRQRVNCLDTRKLYSVAKQWDVWSISWAMRRRRCLKETPRLPYARCSPMEEAGGPVIYGSGHGSFAK